MLIELAIAFLVVLIFLTVFYALHQFGLFHPVDVKVGKPPIEFKGQEVAYKLERGPYNQAGHLFTDILGDVGRAAPDPLSMPSISMIGFYYDDPQEVEPSKCRYAAGIILPTQDKEIYRRELAKKEYLFTKLPSIDHVVHCEFPYNGAFSILIAVRRVYPRIMEYITEHNLCAHPCLEVYHEDKMYFILPLSKQDHFYLFDEEDEDDEREESDNQSNSDVSRSASNDRLEDPMAARGHSDDEGDADSVKKGSHSDASRKGSATSSFEELSADENDDEEHPVKREKSAD